ncbi:MAG: prolyl oligopeptidase family serine peptidase, partial [Candidatus Marinimicrobia bacterium]|nr:prolyl oligopeptidase family serine peptidase [Candidatus Neomarinimicrobiota bacterium]
MRHILRKLCINSAHNNYSPGHRIIRCPGFISVQLFQFLFLFAAMLISGCGRTDTVEGWPSGVREIEYLSQADSTFQPALFYQPDIPQKTPLLVALHTWSGDYLQKAGSAYAEWCIENSWTMIHPNFRGPNTTPQATGSSLVVGDILSAVKYARQHSNIDSTRIYLIGSSGGGYTALMMLGKHPDIWAGVSAWVPIVDLRSWYFQSAEAGRKYAQDIINSCGGKPGDSEHVDEEYRRRSPVTYLSRDIQTPVDI